MKEVIIKIKFNVSDEDFETNEKFLHMKNEIESGIAQEEMAKTDNFAQDLTVKMTYK